jgi:hypothetical protein
VRFLTAVVVFAALCPAAWASGAWIGLSAGPITEEERETIGLRLEIGLRVSSIVEGGPADKAGLRVGDVILALHDTKVGSVDKVRDILRAFRPGQEIRVIFLREGKLWDGSVILGDKNAGRREKKPAPPEEAKPPVGTQVGEDEDIGPRVREILGEVHFETLAKLARNFGYKGKFTRQGLNGFFSRIGFDEKAMRENLKRMGVERKRIDALIELLEGPKESRETEKAFKGRWIGTFRRGRVSGTLELDLKGVDRLGNVKGKLTVEYGRVRLRSAISGRLSADAKKIAFRTHGVGGYWTFEGEMTRGGESILGKFSTVGSFGLVRSPEGEFRLERKK